MEGEDWKDVSLYQPTWQEEPVPYQSSDPEPIPVRRGLVEDDEGELDEADTGEANDDGMGLGLTGVGGPPAPSTHPTTAPPTTAPPTTPPPTTPPPTTPPPTTPPPTTPAPTTTPHP